MQVGEGSEALKPLAQGDSSSPGAVSYSPRSSCCIHGNTALGLASPTHGQQGGRGAALPAVHSCAQDQCLPISPDLGAEEQGQGSLRGSTDSPGWAPAEEEEEEEAESHQQQHPGEADKGVPSSALSSLEVKNSCQDTCSHPRAVEG